VLRNLIALALLIAFSAPAYTQTTTKLVTPTLVIGGALSGADLAMTVDVLNRGYHEANPALRWLERYPTGMGFVKAGIDTGVIIWLHSLKQTHPKAAFWASVTFTAVKAVIVGVNVRRLRLDGEVIR
jgi:hypothetical protein